MSRVSIEEMIGDTGKIDPDQVERTIDDVWDRSKADRAAFDQPESVPDEQAALEYLQNGAGQAIGIYMLLRTDGRTYRFSAQEFERLEEAMQNWLSLYAACYGTQLTVRPSIRTAAETLLETEELRTTAQLLTGVPNK